MTTVVYNSIPGKVDIKIDGRVKHNVPVSLLPTDYDIQSAVSQAITQPGSPVVVRSVSHIPAPRYLRVYGVAQ